MEPGQGGRAGLKDLDLPAELAALPPLAGARVLRLIRDLPQRRVWEIRLQGERAFLKQFRTADPAATALGAARRLDEAAAAFGNSPDCVAPALTVLPEAGAVVLRAAPGVPLVQALDSAPAAERARLVARAGAWLAHLAGPAREEGRFGPRFWLRGIEERLAATTGDWADRALVSGVLRRMAQDGRALAGTRVERARLHGDLTGDNLFYDAVTDRMTGIDLQDWGAVAVVRDAARLLVWLESRRAIPLPRIDGIAAPDHQALTAVPGLIAPDQRALLRFMIGEIMLAYYLDSARQPVRRSALAGAMRDWAQATSASAAS